MIRMTGRGIHCVIDLGPQADFHLLSITQIGLVQALDDKPLKSQAPHII